MPLVTIGQLARELMRDPKAIRKHIEAGHITRRPDGLFDLDTARTEFETNVAHERGRDNANRPVVEMRQSGGAAPAQGAAGAPRGTEYSRARAAVQVYEAQLKKLRYEERARNLAPVCDIEAARFQEMRVIRDACLNLPARISATLAGETDEHRCYQILENELITIFSDYADGRIN